MPKDKHRQNMREVCLLAGWGTRCQWECSLQDRASLSYQTHSSSDLQH